MRGDMGETVPVLRDFWVETTLAPLTPGKPTEPNGQALSNQGEIAMVSKEVVSSSQCYAGFTGVESTSSSSSIHQDRLFASRNSIMKETDDLLAHWRGMRFSDLLALNHGLGIPMGGNQATNGLLTRLDSQCQSTALMSDKQESIGFGGSNKTAEELLGSNQSTQIQQKKSRPVIMMNAYPPGCIPVFAPVTPDHYKGLQGNAAPGKTFFSAERHPNKQNLENNKVSAIDDLQGVQGTQSATDSTPIERYDPYEEDNLGLDLNKTSQQKPRRKKHRPKVVSEAKLKQTPQQRTPKSADANETPRSKRKCVRKNKDLPSTTPPEHEAVTLNCRIPNRAVRSCRKVLNFDFDLEDEFMEATRDYDIYISMSQREAHTTPHSSPLTPSMHEFNAATEYEKGKKTKNLTAINLQKGNSTEAMDPKDVFAHNPYYSTRSNLEHRSGLKRANSCSDDAPNRCTPSQANYLYLGNAIFSCGHGVYFPKIHKKRRTEKVLKPNTSHILSFANALESSRAATSSQNYPREDHGIYFPEVRKKRRTKKVLKVNTSRILSFTQALGNIRDATGPQNYQRQAAETSKCYSISVPRINIGTKANSQASQPSSHQDNKQFIKWGDINQLNKRFIAPIYVHDLDSEDGYRKCQKSSRSSAKGRVKGTWKKNMVKSRKKKSAAMVNKRSLTLYDDRHFTSNPKGRFLALPWINTNTTNVDAIIEGMKQLSLNREGRIVQYREKNALIPYHVQNNKTNALVLYRRDGSIIPFERAQSSRRCERAKVDLDDETNRVWNLLLEDINNQGIDGTDEEKTFWWEEERNVFRGRVDSFIARIRLVQGDRRFSPWKGSVVDSVVGVFLTQNVSDHLSSSAYMSLAARYPLKSANEVRRDFEEGTGTSVKEPETYIVEFDDNSDNLALNEKTMEGYICDRNSRTLNDTNSSEEKVRNSIESQLYRASSIKELDIPSSVNNRAIDDVTSSQNSVSSLNSVESLGLHSDNSSDVEDVTNSSLLLQLAETPILHATYAPIDQVPSCQSDVLDQEEIIKDAKPSQKKFRTKNDSITNVSNKCSAIYQLHPVEEYHLHSVDEESRSVSSTNSVENFATESATELHKKASTSNLGPTSTADHVCSFYVLEGEEMVFQSPNQPVREQQDTLNPLTKGPISPQMNIQLPTVSREDVDAESACASISTLPNNLTPTLPLSDYNYSTGEAHKISKQDASKRKIRKNPKLASYDWDSLRKQAQENGSRSRQRTANTMDSLDWEAIRCADVSEISDTIRDRGMNNMLAERIKEFLDRLINDHGSIDLEWLRDVPPDKAKEYLLSMRGLGLKSVECVRLLTLHHLAFPVDTNVGRIAVRLGWVPLQPLPESLQLHLLELYPVLESIQKYLWPRLCKLDQRTLYELHYHMITFGKVFCTKRQPNCNACPLRGECRHFASAFASARLALPGPQERSIILSDKNNLTHQDPQVTLNYFSMPPLMAGQTLETKSDVRNCEPIVEIPASPEQEPEHVQTLECDIEDPFSEDPNEIPTIKLNMEEFTQTLQAYMQSNKELQEGDMSKALVALAAEAASIPTPKLKNVSRLRTEHHVFELPDTHHLLRGLDKREPDDPCPYLLAIWSPGETANSTEPPEKRCTFQEPSQLCSDETCLYCNSQREANSQIVRGTLLIPCRTAMRGRFPLNGTYFQVNEVFADQDSSLNPIQVSRASLWNLPRRTVYFGTSIPTIFRGLSTEGIQHCFWRGYVCVRGFDQKTRAPCPLMARLHFPASKSRARGRSSEKD